MGTADTYRLIGIVNVMIEARTKTGGLLWRDSLKDFFTSLTPANWLFDPKVVYDHYEDQFVVVDLERFHAESIQVPDRVKLSGGFHYSEKWGGVSYYYFPREMFSNMEA